MPNPKNLSERREAVDTAIAEVRLEGQEIDPSVAQDLERYARGEIGIGDVKANFLRKLADEHGISEE